MDARRLVTAIAREFRSTRIAGGWSQAFIARRAGISASQYGRLERDELDAPDIEQICRASRALGLEASIRLYPRGTRPRDAAQLRLLTEFEELLGPGLHMGREIPLPVQGDRRKIDRPARKIEPHAACRIIHHRPPAARRLAIVRE